MAKKPVKSEAGKIIEAQIQQAEKGQQTVEEEHRAILEQAKDKFAVTDSAQRAIFDHAIKTHIRAAEARRAIIDRALIKNRTIEAEHRAVLERALHHAHNNTLSQGLLKLPEVRKLNATSTEPGAVDSQQPHTDESNSSK